VIEQVEYDPYGRVRRTALADFDHDGAIVTADIFANLAAFYAPSPAADHDWDGAVAPSDIFAFLAHWFAADATPRDQLSSSGNDNPIGYCGYYHDRETVGIMGERNGGLYQVRHRVYDPHAGRWLQRDPAGFVDGCNLYEYCTSTPQSRVDPWGLDDEPTGPCQPPFSNDEIQQILEQERHHGLEGGATEEQRTLHRLQRALRNATNENDKARIQAEIDKFGQDSISTAPIAVVAIYRLFFNTAAEEIGTEVRNNYVIMPVAIVTVVAGTVVVKVVMMAFDDVAGAAGRLSGATDDAAAAAGKFKRNAEDIVNNSGDWEAVSTHAEKATRKGARNHGSSSQTIYRNKKTGEEIVRHTVTDDSGRVVDDHFRPNYKPRVGE
jgi:RHS repeat-associated protein